MHASGDPWGDKSNSESIQLSWINVRIGIDLGENAVIQSGWDIHPNIINLEKNGKNNKINKKEQPIIKKPVYDILGYTTSIAVKMTALANPNHMVIGQLVYDVLEDNQKSVFQQLGISPRDMELC
jgi:hypothetical protein